MGRGLGKGHEGTFWEMEMFLYLNRVDITWVYMYILSKTIDLSIIKCVMIIAYTVDP